MEPSLRNSRAFHAVTMTRLLTFVVWSIVVSTPLAGQTESPPLLTVQDGITTAAAALIWATPSLLSWNTAPPICAPCDTAELPAFDRWAVNEPETIFARASDVVLIGMAVGSWLDLAGDGRTGKAAFVASLQSAVWAEAVTHFAKGAIGRKRPVLYTEMAPDVADDLNNQRAMPSGHTSMAFALATSYWLSRRSLTERDKPWLRWVLMAGAAGVGVLRVAAGKHHPSDVLIGAGVGVATAVVTHEIRF